MEFRQVVYPPSENHTLNIVCSPTRRQTEEPSPPKAPIRKKPWEVVDAQSLEVRQSAVPRLLLWFLKRVHEIRAPRPSVALSHRSARKNGPSLGSHERHPGRARNCIIVYIYIPISPLQPVSLTIPVYFTVRNIGTLSVAAGRVLILHSAQVGSTLIIVRLYTGRKVDSHRCQHSI